MRIARVDLVASRDDHVGDAGRRRGVRPARRRWPSSGAGGVILEPAGLLPCHRDRPSERRFRDRDRGLDAVGQLEYAFPAGRQRPLGGALLAADNLAIAAAVPTMDLRPCTGLRSTFEICLLPAFRLIVEIANEPSAALELDLILIDTVRVMGVEEDYEL